MALDLIQYLQVLPARLLGERCVCNMGVHLCCRGCIDRDGAAGERDKSKFVLCKRLLQL